MRTAKIFLHNGAQAVQLPMAIRFKGLEVAIEKHGRDVVLKPLPTPSPQFQSFKEMARHLAEKFPVGGDFPAPPPRPKCHS